jgi:hypothetical protein
MGLNQFVLLGNASSARNKAVVVFELPLTKGALLMRIKSVSAKRFFKTLALGSAIAVAAVGLPFAAAAPANAVDPVVTTASVTSNTFAVSKVGSSYKIALDLNDAKYSNKTVNVYVTRIVYGQKIVVASRTVKLGTGAVGSTTTTRKIKTGDTIKVTKGSLVVFTRKITSVGLGDVIHPTLSITDNINGLATGAINYTFTFSEAVTGFSADDVTVVGGTKGTLTGAAGGTTYGLIVTPLADSTATITVDVAANSVTDLAKNGNVAAAQNVQLVNTHNPAIVITDDYPGVVHANDQVVYTFTFNQPVTGFESSDIVVVNGTKGAFVALNQTTYTLVVTAPGSSVSGNISVNVAAGAATSIANSATSLAAAESLQPLNTTNPAVTITDGSVGTLFAGQTITYTFTFGEAVSGFTNGDVVVTGGTKGTFTPVSALVYTLVVTPNDNSNTSMTLDIAAGAGTAVATGNPTAAATQNVQPVDTRHQSAAISNGITAFTDGITDQTTAITYTFTFTDPVNGFDAQSDADVLVTGGAKVAASATASGDKRIFTVQVIPTAATFGNLVVSVLPAGGGMNVANSNPIAAVSNTQKYDLVHTLVKLTTAPVSPVPAGSTYTLHAEFNKSVTGLTTAGFNVVNGTATGLSGSGLNWIVTITPAGAATTVTVNVIAAAVTNSLASLALTQAITGPTVTLSAASTGTVGTPLVGSFTVAIDLSATPTVDLARGNISITGLGTGNAVLTGSGKNYTLTVTPGTGTATIVISVAGSQVFAANSLGNSASNALTFYTSN